MLKLSDARSEIGFCQNNKAMRVRDKDYPVFDTGIFDKFFEGRDIYRLNNYFDQSLTKKMQYIGGDMYMDSNSHGLVWRADKNQINTLFVPQNGSIWSTTIQDGTDFYKVDVCESTPEEYKNIVPEFVINAYAEHKDNFDEVVVLYPEEQKVSLAEPKKQPFVDDPFLVGKLKCMPGKYFLISYWADDVNAIGFFQEKMSKMLIQQEELLLQSATKMLGVL